MTVLATPLAILNFSPFIDKLKNMKIININQTSLSTINFFINTTFNTMHVKREDYLQSNTITTSFGPLVAAMYQGRTLGS